MKLSFCMMGFGYTQEIAERCITLCSRLGYDGIEFWKQYLDTADLEWLKRACDDARLEIIQVCPYFDFTGDPAAYEATLREAERFTDYARALGAVWVRTYTGRVGSGDATDEQWERCVEGLKLVCDMGAAFGIEFPLETHQVIHSGACLTDTSASTLRLLALVDRSNLRVALQTPLKGETSEESAERLGPHVVQVQAHNWLGATETAWGTLTYLDAGDLDFPRHLAILRRAGFDGVISIDHPTHSGQHQWEDVAEHEIQYLKRLTLRTTARPPPALTLRQPTEAATAPRQGTRQRTRRR